MSEEGEPDQEPGAPHPRATHALIGHREEEAALAAAAREGRLHHAWLLTGPKGVGKATLAYRFARVLLGARAAGPRPFDVAPDDPVARRIEAGAHPDLFVLRRGPGERAGKPRREIAVDDARALGAFFTLKPAEGGWRVAIVDAVDEMNRNAANAILKTLEEPPAKAVLILVCHAPGAVLATLRSRCRRLRLRPLGEEDLQAAVPGASPALLRLAAGRPGRAIALRAAGAEAEAERLAEALEAQPGARAGALRALAFGKTGPERLALTLELAQDWLRRRALEQALAPRPARTPERLEEGLAGAWFQLEELRGQAEGLGLDPAHAMARAMAVLERVRC